MDAALSGVMLATVVLAGCGESHAQRLIPARPTTTSPCSHNLFSEALVSPTVGYLAEQRGTLMQTSNGGRRWQAAPLVGNHDSGLYDTGPDDVQFVDPRHGWTITWPRAVYRTADAGRHWAVSDPLG